MAKRRLISQLPAFNQTTDLRNFFGCTVDEVFQPGTAEQISGYIGRRPSTVSPEDFYVGEPTAARAAYQLEAGMVSYDTTGTLTNALAYPDFVGYLDVSGADIDNQQRMFETEYYSWSAPVNIDALVNYRDYYWFGFGTGVQLAITADVASGTSVLPVTSTNGIGIGQRVVGAGISSGTLVTSITGSTITLNQPTSVNITNGALINVNDLPMLVLTVPITLATGDAVTTTYDLPPSIISVPHSQETPAVYVNNLPVGFTVIGDTVVLNNPPPNGFTVIVVRVPSLITAISGSVTVNVSDINSNGVTYLSSGMRIKVIDALYIVSGWDASPWDNYGWDADGNGIFMVDGIGQSARFTVDEDMTRGLAAQYVTIDRSSRDNNLWSLHNWWVHKDTFAWSGLSTLTIADQQATRPIIEFIRDLVRWSDSATLVNSANSGATTLTFTRALPALVGRQVFGPNIAANTLVQSVNGATITLSNPVDGPILSGTVMTFRQQWSESIDPLFMLYDLHDVALNDTTVYPGSSFVGNPIFTFSTGNTPIDPVLRRPLAFDNNDSIVFDNRAVSFLFEQNSSGPRYTYSGGNITGIFQYATKDTTPVYSSLWNFVGTTTTQAITNGFYEVPLNLEANANSQDVTTISRSTWVDQFREIIANQIGLTGNPLSDNNYRDTARDLTLGTSILQHRAPMLKAMLLAADGSLDLPQAIRFADQEYNRFRNKFANKLVDLSNRGVLLDTDSAATWVTTTLNVLKRDKNSQFPFALNTIAGGNYFIPPTPTCLGIQPAAVPAFITDTTYASSVQMILGHDGSLTPCFNDWRDPIMLALEQAIYDNLPSQFQTEARPLFDIQQWIGGRYFSPANGYSRTEVSAILAPMFELWALQANLDYRDNPNFDYTDPFTWNYRGVLDVAGNPLPGNWRAIYRWYYGTDAPHLRPWEMLGFVSEPTWWQTTYGSAPYTSTNTTLWTALEHGTIAHGSRAGTDPDYARPGLSQLLPVDAAGSLLNPVQIGIVVTTITTDMASRPWVPGDEGPVENLWRINPSYRFALAIASFLMKPARMIEQCWDTLNLGFIGSQWVVLNTMARPQNADLVVHGENDGIVTGVSQWISAYLRFGGHTSAAFGNEVRGLDVRLIHRMAGFTSSDDMQVISENFGLVPSEDVTTMLYVAPITRNEVYSGVIVQWTGRSWRAIGYDARNPYFTVIPPDTSGPKGTISLSNVPEPVILEWRANAYYAAGVLVLEYNSVWQCLRGHTSGSVFEQNFWTPRSDINPAQVYAPRVVTYQSGLNTTQQVLYGDEFFTYQGVADFLLGWQRWLESRGWQFNTVDQDGQLLDWSLAVREFLSWAQVQWAPGNFIALSPGQQQLNFETQFGTILNIESATNPFFGLSDRAGRPINKRDALVNRLDGNIGIVAKDADIFCARLGFADIEHALILSNVTIFDDDIYLPLFGMRQTRMQLICKRARDWAGRLDAPGFVILGNQLKSDFDKAVEDIRLMFDIELADRADLRDYARHNIGFQPRDYMANLLLSSIEQFEFYAGMIQQKGAPGVFDKLNRSNRASSGSQLQFLEEWGIRIGEFGAPVDPFMSFMLSQLDNRDDPQLINLVPVSNAPLDWIVMATGDMRWLDLPDDPASFFTMRATLGPAALPTAGPVRLTDVSETVFHIADVTDLYATIQAEGVIPFPTGSSTWVYERADGTYTVLRSFETGSAPNAILKVVTSSEDITVTTTRVYFQNSITLTAADVGNYLVIDGLTLTAPELEGLVTILDVNTGSNYVDLTITSTAGFDFTTKLSSAPFVRVLREVRFATSSALASSGYAYATGDLAWIDSYSGGWAVLQWNGTAWVAVRLQPFRTDPTTISQTVIYSAGTRLSNQEMIIDEPVVDEVTVIDPLSNLIAGIADREIDFKTNYDPAGYSAGSGIIASDPWGMQQVGRVWWNLSTVKFLDPYTDTLGITNQRDLTELAYRTANWAHVAPASSVDVYEWTQSTLPPINYNGPGTVYNSDNPSWSEQTVYDIVVGQFTTLYFFWVTGLTVTPNVPFRHADIATVALAIENPSGLDLAWMAPISASALIVSGVLQFLNDTTTVMKVRLTLDPENAGRHSEWDLMRPNDETSLPSSQIWGKLRDSLGGFDAMLQPIPSPTLRPLRATGIRQGQSMFAYADESGTARAGLLDARRSFVDIINTIFNASPIRYERLALTSTLNRSTPVNQFLIWSQIDASYVWEPPPRNEWDMEVFSLDQRNLLLARSDFQAALTSGKKIRVLINGFVNPLEQWSIWEFDPVAANALITANPLAYVPELLVNNADLVFNLALAYEYSVPDMAMRDELALNGTYGIGGYGLGPYGSATGAPLNTGDRVLVLDDTNGFWAIYKYLPNDPFADNAGYILWRVQSYRTDDFIEQIDWYAAAGPNGEPAYIATNPPVVSYATIAARNLAEGASPTNQFVQIQNDGTGHWIWTQYDVTSAAWITVAMQGGTLALSSALYAPDALIHGGLSWLPTASEISTGSSSFTLVDASPVGLGQFVIGTAFDRSTRVLSISGNTVTINTPTLATVPVGETIAFTTLSLTDIATRDGSWDIIVLADALRYGGLLLDSEINTLFFSMLNFVHVQQDDVDWAFKTSFMTIVGYNVRLEETPVLLSDQTSSLVSYINEVKPYRVKIRSYSTQYNTDLDIGTVQATEDYALDLTLLFDRYTVDGWDVLPWDVDHWDDGERISTNNWDLVPWDSDLWDSSFVNKGYIFAHTTVNTTLTAAGPTIDVDDIRQLLSVYVYLTDVLTPVDGVNVFTLRINNHEYEIGSVVADVINVSTQTDGAGFVVGVSGRITTTGAKITVADGTAGNVVEAIIAMPDAALRITNQYQPAAGMSPNDLSVLLNLGLQPNYLSYAVSSRAATGATTLSLASTTGIVVNAPVIGPSIVAGTLVTGVTSNTITLSMPITGSILAAQSITVGMPVWLDGDSLTPSTRNYIYDGGAFSPSPTDAVAINPPLTSRPNGFDLREPYENGQPEERVPFNSDDSLHMLVTGSTVQWMTNSRLPATIRMPPARDASGDQIVSMPNHGPQRLSLTYQVLDEYVTIADSNTGTLGAALQPNDTTITVNLDPATSGAIAQPFSNPKGSIWIGSERIEYAGYARSGAHTSNDVVTLSQIVRGTHGTSIAEQRTVTVATGTGVSQSFSFSGTGVVEVMIDRIATSQFTTTIGGGNTEVFVTAPVGAFVVVALTTGYVYAQGMTVLNGDLLTIAPLPLEPALTRLSGVSGFGKPASLARQMMGAAAKGLPGHPTI